MDNLELKTIVRQKYGEIAETSSSCCGSPCCGTGETFDYTVMSDDYTPLDGYVADADLGLGCGLPTEHAEIAVGSTVLDLGSGAGNDVFIARQIVGESGKVIGLDFTDQMLEKARLNCSKLGFDNVEFVKGDIEDMPIESNSVDIAFSNCVLNLVPDKRKAFAEIFRVIRDNGHFCVSDIVIKGALPEKLQKAAAFYTGCVSGAIAYDEYLSIIESAGFINIQVPKEKTINIPDEILLEYVDENELEDFKQSGTQILSITVKAYKIQ